MESSNGIFALAGLLAGFFPQMILEKYKKHLERCAVAHAFIGEISSIIDMTKRRELVKHFTEAKNTIANQKTALPISVFDFGIQKEDEDPVFKNYIKKLGLLGGALPRDIGLFYAQLKGIRVDLIRLANGTAFKTYMDQHRIISDDLLLWNETENIGNKLLQDLELLANLRFFNWKWKYTGWLLVTIFLCSLIWILWPCCADFVLNIKPLCVSHNIN